MASALKLKNDIQKLKKAIDNKATNPKFIPKLKEQLEKLEGDLAKLKKTGKPGKRPYTRAEGSALNQLKNKLKGIEKQYKGYSGKSALSLERDANRPAKPIGKRKSKSGNTYYEYRANRIDVKQPPRVFPKLEGGGETNDGKLRFDMYGYVNANSRTQDGDEIIRVVSYEEAEKKAEKFLEENKYQLVELYRKDDFVGSIRTKGNFVYSSRYKKEKLEDGGYMEEGGYMKGGGVIRKLLDFQRKYDENEAINYHSENVVLLAETFGTKEDVKEAKAILKQHEEEGHLTRQNAERRDKLSEKLEAIWEKEINSYEEGGYMAGGEENPVENSTMKGKTITIKLPNETESFKDKVVEEYSDHVWGKKGVWSKKYIVGKAEDGGYMADGGMSQGYDDREDERLSMEHGKIGNKDFVGSHSHKEHSRRDDARFEERKMAMGGVAEHGIMKGDHVVDIYEDTLVIENGGKKYFVFIKTGEREEVAEKGGYMTHGGETHRSEKNKK